VCRPLLCYAEHFFTAGSITLRDSEAEWNGLAALAGVSPDRLRLLNQVHGRVIARVTRETVPWTRPEADGVVTDDPSVALVVRVADCAPVLLVDRRRGVVAAVHAGWRSTMQQIVPAAIDALTVSYGSQPGDLIAAIGPSLGTCCGEMGEEVVDAFRAAGHEEATLEAWFRREPGKRPHFDLWRANRDQLEGAGVPGEAIHVAGLCTRTHPGIFHSYRADGAGAGRMAAVIRTRSGGGSDA
jgi:hypothetical protein